MYLQHCPLNNNGVRRISRKSNFFNIVQLAMRHFLETIGSLNWSPKMTVINSLSLLELPRLQCRNWGFQICGTVLVDLLSSEVPLWVNIIWNRFRTYCASVLYTILLEHNAEPKTPQFNTPIQLNVLYRMFLYEGSHMLSRNFQVKVLYSKQKSNENFVYMRKCRHLQNIHQGGGGEFSLNWTEAKKDGFNSSVKNRN